MFKILHLHHGKGHWWRLLGVKCEPWPRGHTTITSPNCCLAAISSSFSIYYQRHLSQILTVILSEKIQACFYFSPVIQFSVLWVWKLQVSAWFSNMSPYCSQSFSRETTYLIFFSLVRGQVFYFSVMGGDSGAVWPAQDSRGCLWSELCVRCWGSWWCRVWTVRISCWVTCPLACP